MSNRDIAGYITIPICVAAPRGSTQEVKRTRSNTPQIGYSLRPYAGRQSNEVISGAPKTNQMTIRHRITIDGLNRAGRGGNAAMSGRFGVHLKGNVVAYF